MDRLIALLRNFGPVMPRPKLQEALRAATGAALGLTVAALMLRLLSTHSQDLWDHPMLIAPFGATTFLIFAVPNSPLAQPWSAVVGNAISALAGVVMLRAGLPILPTAALAVMLAVLAMALLRAQHPPGGAVALFTVLAANPTDLPGLGFVYDPVALGTVSLVVVGILWARATGRVYPFRLAVATAPPVPMPEHGTVLSTNLLAAQLSRLRLEANLGVADLARLIEAVETEAITRNLGPLNAAQMMTRNLVSVAPDASLPEIAQIFRSRAFKTLPIRNADGSFGGLVAQAALVGRADPTLSAAVLANPTLQPVAPETPLADLIALLVEGGHQALPVLVDNKLVGLITRSDMIGFLAGRRHA